MNFAELKEEFYARGTDYLSDDATGEARAERWLNQAYKEILAFQSWPFLESFAYGDDGAGFVEVPDLRKVLLVGETAGLNQPVTNVLEFADWKDLAREGEDMSAQGTPVTYSIQNTNVITAYPLGGTIRVDYIMRAPSLSGTATPIFDEAYHDLIIDRAMVKAYKDSDNFDAAAALAQEYAAGLQSMSEDYMMPSRDVTYLQPTGSDV
jgi:hypothetical protein